ncbi:HTH domain-containing protein, partial [Paenibacillus lautus]|uniref:HTH domain-containing protein n=1 Tax=Paenibacillus lautus TaxID=1401 RepID=UPI003D2C4EBF
MGKIRKSFTEKEIQLLEENPNIHRVTEKNITYSPTFKVAAVQAYQAGQTPLEIFLKAGFNTDIIGQATPKKSLLRWRNIYSTYG